MSYMLYQRFIVVILHYEVPCITDLKINTNVELQFQSPLSLQDFNDILHWNKFSIGII